MSTATETLKTLRVSVMNAIHDMPLLVARDEGFFRDGGLNVEIVNTAGTAQKGADHRALRDNVFQRLAESTYESGGCDQFRMCEWGVMKRTVESIVKPGHRPAKIVGLGSAMSTFAIVVDPKSGIYEPEQLKNTPIAVSPYNGSHFTMLKMLEGFIHKRDYIKWSNVGTHQERLDALFRGEVMAASLMEPWISVAEKRGARVIMESHSSRSEGAADELDGPTLKKLFDAEGRAAEAIQQNPTKYAHYLLEEAGGELELADLRLARILNGPLAPYTRERFEENYQWTLDWGLAEPGATYENTVDNRAWELS